MRNRKIPVVGNEASYISATTTAHQQENKPSIHNISKCQKGINQGLVNKGINHTNEKIIVIQVWHMLFQLAML